jgi:hypothetical protein
MNNETLIYKLLARALLDMRIASKDGNSQFTFEIADIFHNIPLQIERVKNNKEDYKQIIEWLEMRCEQKKMRSWLETAILDCTQNSD